MKRKAEHAGMMIMFVVFLGIWFIPDIGDAHCDTLYGPVVMAAKTALERGDVTPVLKWIQAKDEKEVKEIFNKVLAVRKQGKEAKGLADMYFFETLVRIHRAGEGAPYTGLKPAGEVEPAVSAADKALESGSVDNLVKLITDAAAKGIRERFDRTRGAKKYADNSVEDGRKFVQAYVEFTHYVERLHLDAVGPSGHVRAETTDALQHHHQH